MKKINRILSNTISRRLGTPSQALRNETRRGFFSYAHDFSIRGALMIDQLIINEQELFAGKPSITVATV